jgi:hypothetical protein
MRTLFILALLFPLISPAAILETQPGDKALEGVKLAKSAKFSGKALEQVGAGLRFKKVVFVKAKVYVGELFLDKPADFVRTSEGALASLDKSNALAMQLNFLRDVDAKDVQGAFQDALKENGVNVEDAAVKKFLEAVKAGGGAKEGKTLVVAAERKGGKEIVTYEDSAGKAEAIEGGPGFIRQIFSLWLGKATDSGVENLQAGILGK